MKNNVGRNNCSFDLVYDELFYLLGDAITKKYGISGENIPQSVLGYMSRKADLLPNGVR